MYKLKITEFTERTYMCTKFTTGQYKIIVKNGSQIQSGIIWQEWRGIMRVHKGVIYRLFNIWKWQS